MQIVQMVNCRANDVEKEILNAASILGLPKILVSDNEPPSDSAEYTQFCTRFCTRFYIRILHSPPYSPQSNGLAERGVQIAKKGLEKLLLSHD